MNESLKQDICRIQDPSVLNSEVEDLDTRSNRFLLLQLCYACKYWIPHLREAAKPDDGLLHELKTFCQEHLLHWVEALSLLGKVSSGVAELAVATKWCKVRVSR